MMKALRNILLVLVLLVLPLSLAVIERNAIRRWFKHDDAPRGRVEQHRFISSSLAREVTYNIYLPPGYDDSGSVSYPVLYMLHGMFRDRSAYIERIDTDIVLEQLIRDGMVKPLILVMPEGDASFYSNWASDTKQAWEDYIVKDLVKNVDDTLPTIAERSGRGITGFSMGGLGAMKIALKYRDQYRYVSSQYGALSLRLKGKFEAGRYPDYIEQVPVSRLPVLGKRLKAVFGDDLQKIVSENPAELIGSTGLKDNELSIWVDCGEDDAFAMDEQARDFHHALGTRGIGHEFHIFPGNHSDSYLREHISEILIFHAGNR